MPAWRDQFLVSIKDAEKNSPVNRDLVEACSQLQDRVAALGAEKEALLASAATSPAPSNPITAAAKANPKLQSPPSRGGADSPDPVALAKMRLELAESLRAQGQLQLRLRAAEEELERLRIKTAEDTRSLRLLTSERNTLMTKVRDRDEELRGKSKLVENVQDELLALTLQLNVAEQQKARIKAENEDLVKRWVTRMGKEADALNIANEPILTKRH